MLTYFYACHHLLVSLGTWLTLILKAGGERLNCHQITMHALRLGRGDIILLTNTHAALSRLPRLDQPFFR